MMTNDNTIEIVLKFKQNEKENTKEETITEEKVWLIMTAAKSFIESRNTIIEVLGSKADEFIKKITEIEGAI